MTCPEMLPMVVTTNLTLFALDPRLKSRIADGRHAVIAEIDSDRYPDRRAA